jgi:murein DD-endopeptidase MepM/ murein hydrolase activator NlpD
MKKKSRRVVPRSSLREKLGGFREREEQDPWAVETSYAKKKPLLESYPFTVFKEMHQQLFPKVLVCLTAIVVVLIINIINIPAVNTLGDGLSRLVNWNMDVAAIPVGAMDFVNNLRGRAPAEKEVLTPGGKPADLSLPVSNSSVLSGYGMREHPERGNEMHYGIDFLAPAGSPVHAAVKGRVLEAGVHADYGFAVILDHGEGLKTFYGRVSDLKVAAGDSVAAGEAIAVLADALEGDSYLHFEVWVNDRPVNPWTILPQE